MYLHVAFFIEPCTLALYFYVQNFDSSAFEQRRVISFVGTATGHLVQRLNDRRIVVQFLAQYQKYFSYSEPPD
jgi:hypothetical protein